MTTSSGTSISRTRTKGIWAGDPKPTVSVEQNLEVGKKGTDAEFRVTFLNGKKITLARPTESQIARYATAGDNGIWLAVLEQGYAKASGLPPLFGGFFSAVLSKDPYAKLKYGDSLKNAMEIITGRSPAVYEEKIFFGTNTPFGPIVVPNPKWTKAEIAKQLKAVMGTEDPVTKWAPLNVIATAGVSTYPVATSPDEPQLAREKMLPMGHAYAIVAYNDSAKKVRLRNPWNKDEKDQSGKQIWTYGTVFDLDLDVFVSNFQNYCLESRAGVAGVK